jgi:hypothetical protein
MATYNIREEIARLSGEAERELEGAKRSPYVDIQVARAAIGIGYALLALREELDAKGADIVGEINAMSERIS